MPRQCVSLGLIQMCMCEYNVDDYINMLHIYAMDMGMCYLRRLPCMGLYCIWWTFIF